MRRAVPHLQNKNERRLVFIKCEKTSYNHMVQYLDTERWDWSCFSLSYPGVIASKTNCLRNAVASEALEAAVKIARLS